jgi:predicted MFS family arabinose efflux permease
MFIINHLPNFLALCGLPPSAAGSAIATIGICNAIGCYSFGRLGAVYSRKHLLALIYIVRAIAIAVYMSMPITVTSTLLFAAVMGFFWLGTAPLTSGMVSHMLGARYLSSIYGPVFMSHQLGAFLGVWLGGLVFDETGGYDNMWLVAGLLGLVAAGFHLLIPERRVERLQFV